MASGCGTSGDATDPKTQNGIGSSDVEPSSSEQSADTVIYVGPSEETDGEHPPVHIPSLSAVENRCHPLNKLLREPGQSRSTPSSPQRSLPMSAAAAARAAPASRAAAKPNGASSARSSPVRVPKTTAASRNGRERPEERWIDGPRISKSRAHGARAMLMAKKDDGGGGKTAAGETWIDGPMHGGGGDGGGGAGGSQHANVYGFMDYHKKNMIKKWVEHQVLYQVTDKQNRHREMKEYTTFKTDELGPRGRASGQEENGDEEPKACDPIPARSMIENNHQVSRGKSAVPVVRIYLRTG